MTERWTARALHPFVGAELVGLDVNTDLSSGERDAILQDVARHGVVLIRGQLLDDLSLLGFAGQLGPLLQIPTSTDPTPRAFQITNLDADGALAPAHSRAIQINLSNEFWHTDQTYMRPRSTVSFLYAIVIPPEGGETQFVDTRRAFERLPAAEQARLRRLSASHSLLHSRGKTGFTDWTEQEKAVYGQGIARPLVHRHEETGRDALCIASHIEAISPYDPRDSAHLLDDLMAHATPPEEIYTHRWRVGDLLMWDNRCTMHRARPYDHQTHGRRMLSTRLIDPADAVVS